MSCRPKRLVVDNWISEMFVSLEKSKKSRPFPQLVYIPIWAFDNNLQYLFSDIPNNDKDYNSFLHLEIENIIDINIHLSYCHPNSNHLWICDDFFCWSNCSHIFDQKFVLYTKNTIRDGDSTALCTALSTAYTAYSVNTV